MTSPHLHQGAVERDGIVFAIQGYVGGCREWLNEKGDCCWAPAEYVLWGKLTPAEGLGPRCYEHAEKHVGHYLLRPRAGAAVIHVAELADAIRSVVGTPPDEDAPEGGKGGPA